MAKIPEAQARLYRNVFVCKRCKTKVRAPNIKILQGKIKCRRCNSHAFRAVRKK
ncbi:MAG: hypothetical protein Q8N77_01695 [Nanoarchaeota archaeon]|nr:hypothetical protein [Nanoarchaeota archaeon]